MGAIIIKGRLDTDKDVSIPVLVNSAGQLVLARGSGERHPESETGADYLVIRDESNLTIVDIQTAITIGAGSASDTHLIGIMINVALTGTCVITGFEGSAETAISITLPAATPAGFIDFKAAINSKGALTITCSDAGDDNNVQVLWRPV